MLVRERIRQQKDRKTVSDVTYLWPAVIDAFACISPLTAVKRRY